VSSHSNQTPSSIHTSARSSTSRQSDQTPRSQTGSAHISLPSISLTTFAGDTCTWLNYRNTCEALVVNNATLSTVQKFHSRIATLQDEGNGLISNLQIKNENFLVAWQLLTQRYNNTRLITMMHAKNLCQIPHVKGDAPSLRRLINRVSSHIKALQALSLNVSVQDLVVNHLILASLDDHSQRDWEHVTASCADNPTSADLITFLETRCRALELIQSNQSVRALPRPSQPADRKVSKHTSSNVATQLQCSWCNESHG
jgi:hypothetical protein